jgi:hypothetical protein
LDFSHFEHGGQEYKLIECDTDWYSQKEKEEENGENQIKPVKEKIQEISEEIREVVEPELDQSNETYLR